MDGSDDGGSWFDEFDEFDEFDGDPEDLIPQVRLDASAARSCAVAVQWDLIEPREPAEDTPFLAELGRRGIAFEQDVVAELDALHHDAVVIDRTVAPDERERRTRVALEAGARIVVAPRLPYDPDTFRVGEPDLLVRQGTSGYVPVDIKHHRTLDIDDPDLSGASDLSGAPGDLRGTLPLAELGRTDLPARPREAGGGGSERGDLLQLAHYWRMVEGLGLAADGVPFGAIIGRERRVVGYDLTEPRFTDGRDRDGERRSALDLYDAEYAERRRIALASLVWLEQPRQSVPIEPVRIAECPSCRWRDYCGGILEQRQDVSLLPRVSRPAWDALRRIGADRIPRLAWRPMGTPIDGMTPAAFAEAVAQARARVGEHVAYRRPGVAQVEVERADVELDVDMENVEDGAYLWGVHVTDRTGAGAAAGLVTDGYHAFVDWDPDAEAAGQRAFAAFWAWLAELRRGCAARGLTLRCYHWSSAEPRWMREAARGLGLHDEVDAALGSGEWVDLLPVFRSQVITGHGNGLKVVAPLLGFAWDDEDPSGTSSMLWWQIATDHTRTGAEQEFTRERLLAYNADDVRATLHVREWMDATASSLPDVPSVRGD